MTVVMATQSVENFLTQTLETGILKIDADLLLKTHMFLVEVRHPGAVSVFIVKL